MTRRFLVPVLILLGVIVLVVGTQWGRIWPANSYWSNEQADELTAAQVALHSLSHSHGLGNKDAHEKQFAAAREHHDRISNQLTSAQNSRDRSGTIAIIAGILTILFGIGLHFVERSTSR